MPLAAYEPQRAPVKMGKVDFSVRGLSTEDLSGIMSSRLAEVQRCAEFIMEGKDRMFTAAGLDALLIKVCLELPWLVAEVISAVSDEDEPAEGPSLMDRARKLSLPVQLAALLAIFKLTFEEAGGVKNWFAETVRELRVTVPALLDANGGLSPQLSAFLKKNQPAQSN